MLDSRCWIRSPTVGVAVIFEITDTSDGRIELQGRFDASQREKAREVLSRLNKSCVIDFERLDYISSAGLGVLLEAQTRLQKSGHKLKLINLSHHVREIFRIIHFDRIFEIE